MSNEEERNDAAIRATFQVVANTEGGLDVLRNIATNWDLFDAGRSSWNRHILEIARSVLFETGDM